jgi:hypothetical protein
MRTSHFHTRALDNHRPFMDDTGRPRNQSPFRRGLPRMALPDSDKTATPLKGRGHASPGDRFVRGASRAARSRWRRRSASASPAPAIPLPLLRSPDPSGWLRLGDPVEAQPAEPSRTRDGHGRRPAAQTGPRTSRSGAQRRRLPGARAAQRSPRGDPRELRTQFDPNEPSVAEGAPATATSST